MKNLNYLNENRVNLYGDGFLGDEHNGAFQFQFKVVKLFVIASGGGNWEHVSVSCDSRLPRWDEMQKIKEMFFEDDEVVMQLHVASENHINNHNFCLHLWKPTTKGIEIPLPPKYMV